MLIVVVALMYFFLAGRIPGTGVATKTVILPTSSAKKGGPTVSDSHFSPTSGGLAPAREHLIPGSNLQQPTVNYGNNPAGAAQHSETPGGYGTDTNGGGAATRY